jgi:hypothetical protein
MGERAVDPEGGKPQRYENKPGPEQHLRWLLWPPLEVNSSQAQTRRECAKPFFFLWRSAWPD